MNFDENIVIVAKDYNKIDGYDACASPLKSLSLGYEQQKEEQPGRITTKMWKNNEKEGMTAPVTLELHQVLDLAIFACRGLEYFQEAYRFPKLYDPENPNIERIGLQGNAMSMMVCTDNPTLDTAIQDLSLAVGSQGEMIGERLRVLSRMLEEMGY
jgi:hypothetical protein